MTFLLILLVELVGVYILGYNIVLSHMLINMKYGASDFVLPSVSAIVGKTVGDEEVG